jgi:hypothetical protein
MAFSSRTSIVCLREEWTEEWNVTIRVWVYSCECTKRKHH